MNVATVSLLPSLLPVSLTTVEVSVSTKDVSLNCGQGVGGGAPFTPMKAAQWCFEAIKA